MFAVTPRLLLRPGWPEDAAALAAAIGHEAVVRNLARAPWPYTLEDAAGFLALPRDADTPRFLLALRESGRVIGGIELIGGEPAELGYWLTPSAWGRGFASEAAAAVVEMARDTLRIQRVIARPFVDNPASGRVLTKLGFRECGTGTLHSLARGAESPCRELVLDLAEAAPVPLAA